MNTNKYRIYGSCAVYWKDYPLNTAPRICMHIYNLKDYPLNTAPRHPPPLHAVPWPIAGRMLSLFDTLPRFLFPSISVIVSLPIEPSATHQPTPSPQARAASTHRPRPRPHLAGVSIGEAQNPEPRPVVFRPQVWIERVAGSKGGKTGLLYPLSH